MAQAQAQAQAQARCMNPWVLHLQKLGLELKCPFCLELYIRPTLLPCNHIFCRSCVPQSYGSDCPLCKVPYIEQDLREAPYMENVVNIYRCLDSSFSMHQLSSDAGKTSVQYLDPATSDVPDHLAKGTTDSHSPGNSTSRIPRKSLRGNELAVMPNNTSVKSSLEKCSGLANPDLRSASGQQNVQSNNVSTFSPSRVPKLEQHGAVYVDMNQVEVSPDSPPSSGASKGVELDDIHDRGSIDDTAGKCLHKKSVKRATDGSGTKGDLYHKKQKQLDRALLEMPQDHSPLAVRNLQNSASTGSEIAKFGSASDTQPAVGSDSASLLNFVCAFCQTWKITEGSGLMQHFTNGRQVSGPEACRSNVIHVHERCIEWAPQVYYKDGTVLMNLDKELARARKLKCAGCGLKGAALGCYTRNCQRSYHVPCAYENPDCRWDTDDFLLFCPAHNSLKFPREKVKKSTAKKSAPHKINNEQKNLGESNFRVSPTGSKNMVLCGSALSNDEKFTLVKFAQLYGATVTKAWSPDVTHVIAATDANGACCRTLKVLMAIVGGKWILNVDWIRAYMESKRPVDEEPYEISVDNHGCCDGPKTGRLKALSNAPVLFTGLKFFFNGDFAPKYKRDLQDLVVAAGGTILESKEKLQQSKDEHFKSSPSTALVVYNEDALMCTGVGNVIIRQVEAEMVAAATGSQVISHTWILDSIASCKLQPFTEI